MLQHLRRRFSSYAGSCHYPLTYEQNAIARARSNSIVVLGAPGTGKSRTLAARVQYLLESETAQADKLFAISSSGSACETVASCTGTWQTLCERVLPLPQDRKLLSASEEKQLFLNNVSNLPVHSFTADDLLSRVQELQRYSITADRLREAEVDNNASELADVLEAWKLLQQSLGVVTLSDAVTECVTLLRSSTELQERIASRHRHLLVDDFEDVTPPLLSLLEAIAPQSLTVFGDDDVGVTSVDSAFHEPNPFLWFGKMFPAASLMYLRTNFRNTPLIATVSAAFIAQNSARLAQSLKSKIPSFSCVSLVPPETLLSNSEDERVEKIRETLIEHCNRSQTELKDTAVLTLNDSDASHIKAHLLLKDVTVLNAADSKGREFSFVIIAVGKPESIIQSSLVSSLLKLPNPSKEVTQEYERRLLYLALSRTRGSVLLAAVGDQPLKILPEMSSPKQLIRLSFSKLDTYERCPRRFWYQYVRKVPQPPSIPLIVGRALHEAVAEAARLRRHYIKQLIDSDATLTDSNPTLAESDLLKLQSCVLKTFGGYFDTDTCKALFESDELRLKKRHECTEALKRFVNQDNEQLADIIEEKFTFDHPQDGALQIVGIWDRVDRQKESGRILLREFKTKLSSYMKNRIATNEQLRLYSAAMLLIKGKLPHEARLEDLTSGDVVVYKPQEKDVRKILEKAAEIGARIRAQAFDAIPTAMQCRICPFNEMCNRAVAPRYDAKPASPNDIDVAT